MATIGKDSNGRKRILFHVVQGTKKIRKTLRLGRATIEEARTIKLYVEDLLSAEKFNRPARDATEAWLKEVDPEIMERIFAIGLVKRRSVAAAEIKLREFIASYITDRTDAKPQTIVNMRAAQKDMCEFFGDETPIRDMGKADAESFERWLRRDKGERKGLGKNTARRIIGRAKQFFRYAIDKGYRRHCDVPNPFAGLECKVGASADDRIHFIPRDVAEKVSKACPDAEWRLIFSLSRFGGLRCPSEHLLLTWGDVNWTESKLTVHSPKTEHHEGHDKRIIPLFPELEKALLEMMTEPKGPEEFIITRYRGSNANLRSQLERIIERAGLDPWPKLFHNLRGATRETELMDTFPAHVVCQWIGNSEDVARKHYLQVTDEHFTQALRKADGRKEDERGTRAAHFPAQHTQLPVIAGENQTADTNEKSPVSSGDSRIHLPALAGGIPLRGVEPFQ